MIRNKNKNSDSGHIDEDQIIKYLNGQLQYSEQREIEAILEENPFLNDAIEGLSEMDPIQIKQISSQINFYLRQHIKKRKRRNIMKINLKTLIWIIIFIVFILIFIAWWLIFISAS